VGGTRDIASKCQGASTQRVAQHRGARFASLVLTPSSRPDAFVSYIALRRRSRTDSLSTSGVRDPAGRSGNFAGHQLDTGLRYRLIPEVLRFEVDVVMLFKGRFLETAPNAPRTGDTHYYPLKKMSI
jgi:hypothetical protein